MSINNQLNVSSSQSQIAQLQAFRAQQFCGTGARPSQCSGHNQHNFAPMPQPQQNMIQNLVEGMMKAFMSILEKLIPGLQGGANGNQGATGQTADPAATPATPAQQPGTPVETTPAEVAPVAPEQAAQCQKLEEEQKAQETAAGSSEAAEKPKNPVQDFINSLRESAGEFIGSLVSNVLEGTRGPRRAVRKVRRALRQVRNILRPKNLRGILSMATSFFGAGGSK